MEYCTIKKSRWGNSGLILKNPKKLVLDLPWKRNFRNLKIFEIFREFPRLEKK
jgi:hypothetical protein